MGIFSLRILTIVNILYFLRGLMLTIVFGILWLLLFVLKHNSLGYFMGWGFLFLSVFLGKDLFNYLKKIIISKTKYPLPLNLICNIIGLGKSYHFGKYKFDLDEIINDNKLPSLTIINILFYNSTKTKSSFIIRNMTGKISAGNTFSIQKILMHTNHKVNI